MRGVPNAMKKLNFLLNRGLEYPINYYKFRDFDYAKTAAYSKATNADGRIGSNGLSGVKTPKL